MAFRLEAVVEARGVDVCLEVADLDPAPQTAVTFAVKASEVAVYRTCRVRTGPGGWCDPVTSSRLCPSDLPRK
jgi:hypothetical protein